MRRNHVQTQQGLLWIRRLSSQDTRGEAWVLLPFESRHIEGTPPPGCSMRKRVMNTAWPSATAGTAAADRAADAIQESTKPESGAGEGASAGLPPSPPRRADVAEPGVGRAGPLPRQPSIWGKDGDSQLDPISLPRALLVSPSLATGCPECHLHQIPTTSTMHRGRLG